ncbi:hypothetical protein CspeluHIS016_0501170 [Cutaneotrichosporon spelunceum]|uniref:Microbial-type PARG catalytic domain-containing protein n=1 Tax=Cutaneotrichosporon spelunceum TaxID=1672016 RepID=A0AAD3YCG5_9TREE|nr:hypothetical protein CspeluHIS016_0501170 [Cutaneotrichosporon spelunceum]
MSRTANRAFSSQNEAFIKQGWYPSPTTGNAVDLSSLVSNAKRLVASYDLAAIDNVLSTTVSSSNPNKPTSVTVTDEASSAAAERLHAEGAPRIVVLNFASARNPGGGYLGGAQAQEEDICRSSALYTTLLQAPDHYAAHQRADGRYSHRMIYSPSVPVYRTSGGDLLPQPYTVDFVTSPAPNYGALAKNNPGLVGQVFQIMRERAARVLALCAFHGAQTLVLGAWGCGVFRNSPTDVAKVFHDLLKPGGRFHGRFDSVVFAIYDRSPKQEVMRAFNAEFKTTAPLRDSPKKDHGRSLSDSNSGSRADGPEHDKTAPVDGQAKITSFFQRAPPAES